MIRDQEGAKELVKRADKFRVHSRSLSPARFDEFGLKKCKSRSGFCQQICENNLLERMEHFLIFIKILHLCRISPVM
jgi:hypothetical protein